MTEFPPQLTYAAPSSEHVKDPLGSEDVNVKVADVLATSPAGPLAIVAEGAVVSIVQVNDEGVGSTLPAWSVERTWNVWLPSGRPVYEIGVLHAVNAAPSRLHEYVTTSPYAEKVNVALEEALNAGGPELIRV